MSDQGKLNYKSRKLLERIIAQRNPALLSLVVSLESCALDEQQRETLRGVLSDELVENGLGEGDEPTRYGEEIDDLIGQLGDN